MIPFQISAFIEVLPPWLPPVAMAAGFFLLLVGLIDEILYGYFGHWAEYNRPVMLAVSVFFTVSIGGAGYQTIHAQQLTLLFALMTFIGGRLIQGAVAAQLGQKLINSVLSGSSGSGRTVNQIVGHIVSSIRQRAILLLVSGTIVVYTGASITVVVLFNTGGTRAVVERFWLGMFFLTMAELAYDFRNFAHRISWIAAIGLMIATAGAFLHSPAGFSNLTVVLTPYLSNPIPDWMRLPLGTIGFVCGVVLWATFYIRSVKAAHEDNTAPDAR
ncbi:hypothetical protein [Salinigranum salinum]|uniref:hypothetical protein n=1 Tax=Salinigranum salinum TaxID=1364937 RepID=UPI0012604CEB|nr:hypothetical protein [Salinigranum salinum]